MADIVNLPRLPRVLVVDDDKTNLMIWQGALRGLCRLVVTASGADALSLFPVFRPDLVILDRTMPGLHGDEVLARIRALDTTGSTRIVIHSALGRDNDQIEGMRNGADLYIPKTVGIAVAAMQVRSLLSMQRHDSSQIVLAALRTLRRDHPGSYAADLLIRGVLQRSEMLTGQVAATELDLAQVVALTETFYRDQMRHRGITVVDGTKADDGALTILGNSELMSSAVANMLEALARRTPGGGEIRVAASRSGENLLVRMSSPQGTGFDPIERARMFVFDIGTDSGRTHVGTALAWETAVRHGGDLVADTIDAGPSLTLTVPSIEELRRLTASAA